MLVQELQRYGRRDRPLQICLAWQEHRKLSQQEFDEKKGDLGLLGEIVCLDPDGKTITWGQEGKGDPEYVFGETVLRRSLTALRKFMAFNTNARVLIGGRRDGFQGTMPGLLEEALISTQIEQPLYLAGGFGGITVDIIKVVGLDDGAWIPSEDLSTRDDRLSKAFKQLFQARKKADPKRSSNGLSEEENRRLAATHRPSEIAALISLGLGRRFAG